MVRLERLFAVISGYVGLVMNPRVMVVLLIVVLMLEAPAKASSSAGKQSLDSRQIRKKIDPSIVYITSFNRETATTSTGGGVLVDKKRGLILTNAHITENNTTVDIVFPAYDAQGDIIREKLFYMQKKIDERSSVLRRQGNITTGRVIFENEDSDLALISVWGTPPKTAAEIDYDPEYNYEKLSENIAVHVFGHPDDERELLWLWDAGHYNSVEGDTLVLDASAWFGNSGGAVTDRLGVMIGIMRAMDVDNSRSYAVSIPPINEMASKIKQWYVFCIQNSTPSKVQYETKWSEAENWTEDTLKPGDWLPYVIEVDKYHKTNSKGGYPRIRYKVTSQAKKEVDGAESVPTDDTDDAERPVEYELTAERHDFGDEIRDRITPFVDDIVYWFGIKDNGKNGEPELKLYQRRKMLWIANHTEHTILYELQWAEGAAKKKRFYLEAGKIKPHFPSDPFSRIPPLSRYYPRIKYDSNKREVEYTLLSWHDYDFDDMRSYFDMDLKEQEDPSLDARHPPHPFSTLTGKFFHFTTTSGEESSGEIEFYTGLYPKPPPLPTTWQTIKSHLLLIACLALMAVVFMKLAWPKIKWAIARRF